MVYETMVLGAFVVLFNPKAVPVRLGVNVTLPPTLLIATLDVFCAMGF